MPENPINSFTTKLDNGSILVEIYNNKIELVFLTKSGLEASRARFMKYSYKSKYNKEKDKLSMIRNAWRAAGRFTTPKTLSLADEDVVKSIYTNIEKKIGELYA